MGIFYYVAGNNVNNCFKWNVYVYEIGRTGILNNYIIPLFHRCSFFSLQKSITNGWSIFIWNRVNQFVFFLLRTEIIVSILLYYNFISLNAITDDRIPYSIIYGSVYLIKLFCYNIFATTLFTKAWNPRAVRPELRKAVFLLRIMNWF